MSHDNLALIDIQEAVKRWPIISFMALSDMRSRYKRSVLGPLWLTLGTAVGSVGLGFLWSELFKVDPHTFVPTLTAGLILWQFISGLMTDASSLFSRQSSIIRNLSLPLAIHPMQLLIRHFINLLHNIPVFIGVAIFLALPVNLTTLLVIPGVLLVVLNMLWMTTIVGILGARFRDFEFIVASVMPLLMFVSPVFYRPNYLPFSEQIIWFNPFSHLIEIVRYPLLGSPPPDFVVITNLVMLVVGSAAAFWLFNKKHNRIAFWI
jgi:ABC-type polysaccharide/polyol phosphate export permease